MQSGFCCCRAGPTLLTANDKRGQETCLSAAPAVSMRTLPPSLDFPHFPFSHFNIDTQAQIPLKLISTPTSTASRFPFLLSLFPHHPLLPFQLNPQLSELSPATNSRDRVPSITQHRGNACLPGSPHFPACVSGLLPFPLCPVFIFVTFAPTTFPNTNFPNPQHSFIHFFHRHSLSSTIVFYSFRPSPFPTKS